MARDIKIISPTATKAITYDQFNNDDIWQEVGIYGESRNKTGEIQKAKRFKKEIATIYRCIDLRSTAISSVPYTIYSTNDGKEILNNNNYWKVSGFEWLEHLPDLLYLTEASLLLTSEAFWLEEKNLLDRTINYRWLAAPYINPVYSTELGITGYERTLNSTGEKEEFSLEEIIYFRIQNPLGELVPDMPQALSAAASAGVIINYEKFISEFYKRGAVKATVLSVDRSVPPREREKLRNFWQDMMSGIKNAFTTEVISGEVNAKVVGEGAGDSEKTEVLRDRRKDIATSMGVPFSLIFGDSSASYTVGATEELNFLKYTIARRISIIQEILNNGIFKSNKQRIRFYIEHLPAFKEFNNTQVDVFTKYLEARLPPSIAAKLSGIQLPDNVTYDDLDKFVAEEKEKEFKEKERIVTLNSKLVGDSNVVNASEDNNIKSVDFENELKVFKKWLKNRKFLTNPLDFESSIITDELKMEIYNNYWKNNSADKVELGEY